MQKTNILKLQQHMLFFQNFKKDFTYQLGQILFFFQLQALRVKSEGHF